MPKLPDLEELSTHVNIAEFLNDDALNTIGARVCSEYETDCESRREWAEMYESALKIAKQVVEPKSFPWAGAANIKYPLIASAAIQFAARAYPEIIAGGRVAGCKVIGRDDSGDKQNRADRVSTYLNYQIIDKMGDWEEDTDKLLHILPIAGLCWRKTYYDPILGCQSEFINPLDVIVHYYTKSLDTAQRITHVYPLYDNEVESHIRYGEFLDIDLPRSQQLDDYASTEDNTPGIFLEQHRWWDLDGDGYQEPYIVTVHRESRRVVRIVARYNIDGISMHDGKVMRITPLQYFTKYSFIPAPDGSFYDIGFGTLLNPLNETINTIFNQLIDSGTQANTGGGWIGKGAKLSGGNTAFSPGEWKYVDVPGAALKDAIVPKPVTPPSQVLFNLLGLLMEAAKQLSTVSDEMTGDRGSPNETATSTLARIEQGMKVFNAVHKRIYRALTKELKKIYQLNRIYLPVDKYANIVDDPQADAKADFEDESIDILPIADPNMSTDMQRLTRIQAVQQVLAGVPGANMLEVARRALESMHVEDLDKLLPDQTQPQQQAPDPKVMEAQAKMELVQKQTDAEIMRGQAEMQLKLDTLQSDHELAMQKFAMELQKSQIELQIKGDEMTERVRMAQSSLETERAKHELERQKHIDAVALREREMDNEIRLKEYQHDTELYQRTHLKQLDLGLSAAMPYGPEE